MFKKLVTVLIMLVSLQSMAQHPFLQSLQPLCGKSFEGKTVFPLDDKDPFAGKRLIMHVSSCKSNEIRIPFHVGEDRSRTWMLTTDANGLLLKHDHRHADGTPDSVTMYGGYANTAGNAVQQFFPADDYTAKLIPAAATNEWNMVISEDRKTFSYILKRNGQLRFRADFDLTRPVSQ
ncbi:MAG TPA: hypothetical protein VEX63_02695 [Flavisolibacter sp.]|jgi:hypothetical protein|nr:hypothetical protein [Flavisolibacter sp.]